MKNKLILMAIKCLKRWIRQAPTSEDRKILVVSTTALGDTLWATPALVSLRESWPQAKIAVLTSPIGEEVLRHNPSIDQLFVLQEPLLFRFVALWRRLKKESFQEIVLFHASQRLTLPLCSLLGAHRIIGTQGINKGLDALLTDPMPPMAEHEIIRRLRLIEALGAKRHTERLRFFLQPEEKISLSKERHIIALHPGSKDSFKRWPATHFIEVGRSLANFAQIWITGVPQESALLEQIAGNIPGAIRKSTANLRSFAAELEHVDLLISNDTGPVHLACALYVPVIALYSPTNPHLAGPHQGEQTLAISRPLTCEPCLKRKCRRPFCLLQIGPEEVVRHATSMLQNVNFTTSAF